MNDKFKSYNKNKDDMFNEFIVASAIPFLELVCKFCFVLSF